MLTRHHLIGGASSLGAGAILGGAHGRPICPRAWTSGCTRRKEDGGRAAYSAFLIWRAIFADRDSLTMHGCL